MNTGMTMYQNWQEQIVVKLRLVIFQNQQVQTDRAIPSNKPDIIISDDEKERCLLTDVAI